jgi:hypothetical protein
MEVAAQAASRAGRHLVSQTLMVFMPVSDSACVGDWTYLKDGRGCWHLVDNRATLGICVLQRGTIR